VFVIGIVSIALRMERTAYRYAGITLAIIVLIPGSNPAWIVALHRFFEVSVQIPPRQKQDAINYAETRACFRTGEICILDPAGKLERVIAFARFEGRSFSGT
jgi:hypothetical protein